MAAPASQRDLRLREAKEKAARKRGLSIRVGVSGLALLFAGAIVTLFWTNYLVAMVVLMSIGFVLILVAFFIIRNVGGTSSLLKGLIKEP